MLARLFFGAWVVLATLAVAREQRQLGAELDEAPAGARPAGQQPPPHPS